MARPTIQGDSNTDQHTQQFWRAFIRLGFAILGFESIAASVYLSLTPRGPHRGALSAIALVVLGASIAGFSFAPSVARRSWRSTFNFFLTLAAGLLLTVCCLLDTGLDSPLVYFLVLPVTSWALVLPVRPVAICAGATLAEIAVVALLDPDVTSDSADLVTLCALVAGVAVLAVVSSSSRVKLQEHERATRERLAYMAASDPLTGCLNHRAFYSRLADRIDRFDRYEEPVSLLMADIDLFKSYNDARGHVAGDEALAAIGSVLMQGARSADVVGRVGGDEFAVILPDTSTVIAQEVAEHLSADVRHRPDIGVSLSIGVASIDRAEPTVIRLGELSVQGQAQRAGAGRRCIRRCRAAPRPGRARGRGRA